MAILVSLGQNQQLNCFQVWVLPSLFQTGTLKIELTCWMLNFGSRRFCHGVYASSVKRTKTKFEFQTFELFESWKQSFLAWKWLPSIRQPKHLYPRSKKERKKQTKTYISVTILSQTCWTFWTLKGIFFGPEMTSIHPPRATTAIENALLSIVLDYAPLTT